MLREPRGAHARLRWPRWSASHTRTDRGEDGATPGEGPGCKPRARRAMLATLDTCSRVALAKPAAMSESLTGRYERRGEG
jgi:hypothetical protein